MEHRCGERRRVGLTVLARRRGWSGWMVAELTNLSISGAFIAAPAGAFPLRSLIQLESKSPDGPLLHCRAMVVRNTPEGVGLVFDRAKPEGLEELFPGELRPPASRSGRTAQPSP